MPCRFNNFFSTPYRGSDMDIRRARKVYIHSTFPTTGAISIIVMLNKGAKGRMAEGVEEEGELYRAINGAGDDSHITSLL